MFSVVNSEATDTCFGTNETIGMLKHLKCQTAKSFKYDQHLDTKTVHVCHITRCVFDNTRLFLCSLSLCAAITNKFISPFGESWRLYACV